MDAEDRIHYWLTRFQRWVIDLRPRAPNRCAVELHDQHYMSHYRRDGGTGWMCSLCKSESEMPGKGSDKTRN